MGSYSSDLRMSEWGSGHHDQFCPWAAGASWAAGLLQDCHLCAVWHLVVLTSGEQKACKACSVCLYYYLGNECLTPLGPFHNP